MKYQKYPESLCKPVSVILLKWERVSLFPPCPEVEHLSAMDSSVHSHNRYRAPLSRAPDSCRICSQLPCWLHTTMCAANSFQDTFSINCSHFGPHQPVQHCKEPRLFPLYLKDQCSSSQRPRPSQDFFFFCPITTEHIRQAGISGTAYFGHILP